MNAKGRATPYHYPHQTTPKGYVATLGGDDRFFGNIVIGPYMPPATTAYFSSLYNGYMTPEEYDSTTGRNMYITHVSKVDKPQGVYLAENVYTGYAKPFREEKEPLKVNYIDFSLDEENGNTVFSVNIPAEVASKSITPTTTARLGTPRIVEQHYENPDGSPIDFSLDILGKKRGNEILAGPFASLTSGENKFIVWKK